MEDKILTDLVETKVLDKALRRLHSDLSRFVVLLALRGWPQKSLAEELSMDRRMVSLYLCKFKRHAQEIAQREGLI